MASENRDRDATVGNLSGDPAATPWVAPTLESSPPRDWAELQSCTFGPGCDPENDPPGDACV